MSDLPPDLPRLRTLETWLRLTLDDVRRRIVQVEEREAERRRGEERRPPPPDWLLEMSLGSRHPVSVHIGGCHAAGKRARPIGRDQAVRALAGGVDACTHCRPDTELGVLD